MTPHADNPAGDGVPSALYAACPECGDETLHTVHKGSLGTRKAYVLDATAECRECRLVHHVTVREAKDVEVPIIVSHGAESVRSKVELPGDDEVAVGDTLLVDGRNVRLTAIEIDNDKRTERARLEDVDALWAKDFEEVPLRFAVNLKHKTASHELIVDPHTVVSVGDEYTFGRLRVVVHRIKVEDRPILKEGSAEAGDIVRVFAKPAKIGRKQYRPMKDVRERQRQREREREREGRGGRRGGYR